MRRMLGTIIAMSVLLSSGCTPMKVDCKKWCKRTFTDCYEEVAIIQGQKRHLELSKKTGLLEKVKKMHYKKCYETCEEKKGVGSNAPEINKCLKKSSCEAYAKCIKKFIKG